MLRKSDGGRNARRDKYSVNALNDAYGVNPSRSEKSSQNYEHDEMTHRIIGAAFAVHATLGPGLFEGVYENALCLELKKRDIPFERQKRFRIKYDGVQVGELIADLEVENQVTVELRAVQELPPVHKAQVIGYLRAARSKRGLLINFNVPSLKLGIRRCSA